MVSWLWEMGMTPARLVRPTVGLMPTTEQADEGQTIEPSVSVPMATAVKPAAVAAGEPELDPQGERSSAYGLRHCPPRPLQPLVEEVERKLAHSLRVVLPSSTAPALRRLRAVVESCGGRELTSASEPAVVSMPSAVSTLSLSRIGIPCSGPRGPPSRSSASRA